MLGDDDEEVQPADAVYLGVSPDRFVKVVRNDDNEIVFDFTWHYGNVEIDRAERTDEGYVLRKDDFGEDGIACRLIPRKGNPFTIRLTIPYVAQLHVRVRRRHASVDSRHARPYVTCR